MNVIILKKEKTVISHCDKFYNRMYNEFHQLYRSSN